MILSDVTLKKNLADKSIVINPIEDYQIQCASIDIRLGNDFKWGECYSPFGNKDIRLLTDYHMICDEKIFTLSSKSYVIRPILTSDITQAVTKELVDINGPRINPYPSNKIGLCIEPKQFMLATTMETISLADNITAFVEGRSSVGRAGLFVQNAGWVDPGFKGQITLELYNASDEPIFLEPGRRIAQLVFAQLDDNADNPYNGKYQGQMGATESKWNEDKEVL